jgi:hypothetical protein
MCTYYSVLVTKLYCIYVACIYIACAVCFYTYQGLKYRIHFYQRQASIIDNIRTKKKFIS